MAYTCQHFHTSTRALRIDEEKLCCDWLTATSCVVQVTMGYNKNVAPFVQVSPGTQTQDTSLGVLYELVS